MVAEHLTNPSVISLALTCPTLYSLCFPHDPCLSTNEKEELLLLLEKDIANLYFCHCCTKLHRWHTRWGNVFLMKEICSLFSLAEENLPCKEHFECDEIFLPLICIIPYHYARLVMDRHLYGRTHGLPTRRCEMQTRMHCPSSKVGDSESLHTRIVRQQTLDVIGQDNVSIMGRF
jgi:hypothetical protein